MKKVMACSLLVGVSLGAMVNADDTTVNFTVGEGQGAQNLQLTGPNLAVSNNNVLTSESNLQDQSEELCQEVSDGDFSARISQRKSLLTIDVNLPGLEIARVNLKVVQDQQTKRYFLVGVEQPRAESLPSGATLSPEVVAAAQETVGLDNADLSASDSLDSKKERATGFVLMLPKNVDPASMNAYARAQAITISFALTIATDDNVLDSSGYDIEGGLVAGQVDQSLLPDQPSNGDQSVDSSLLSDYQDQAASSNDVTLASDSNNQLWNANANQPVASDVSATNETAAVSSDQTQAAPSQSSEVVASSVVTQDTPVSSAGDSSSEQSSASDSSSTLPVVVQTNTSVPTVASDSSELVPSDVSAQQNSLNDQVLSDAQSANDSSNQLPSAQPGAVSSVTVSTTPDNSQSPSSLSDSSSSSAQASSTSASQSEDSSSQVTSNLVTTQNQSVVTVTVSTPLPVTVAVNAPAEDGDQTTQE